MCSHGDTVVLQLRDKPVDVDRCLAPLVQVLNDNGFPTVASCCGHNHRPGMIALRDGRELAILPNYEAARRLDPMWPDIHGEWKKAAKAEEDIMTEELAEEFRRLAAEALQRRIEYEASAQSSDIFEAVGANERMKTWEQAAQMVEERLTQP